MESSARQAARPEGGLPDSDLSRRRCVLRVKTTADGGVKDGQCPRGRKPERTVFGLPTGWTVFHLPSIPGARNTVGSAGSNPAGGERRVAWAGVRLHQLGPVYTRGPERSEATRRRLSRPAFAPVATVAVGSVDWGHRTAEGAVMLGPAVD